jgi:uncharacterized protein YbjQ (UPF0145 family)
MTKKKIKSVTITKVVSRFFVWDMVSSIQNLFGLNLSPYERMLKKAIAQINEEIEENNYNLDWYRYEITQLTNGALCVMLYGDLK